MAFTTEDKLEFLLRLPWAVVCETSPEGDHLLRVDEIPSAVASGESAEGLERDFWKSLRSSLEALLHFGDPISTPLGIGLPWETGSEHSLPSSPLLVRKDRPPAEPDVTAAAGRWHKVPA